MTRAHERQISSAGNIRLSEPTHFSTNNGQQSPPRRRDQSPNRDTPQTAQDTVTDRSLEDTTPDVPSQFRVYCVNVAAIGRQVARALHYAHQRGVIHRDIKPANLMLDTAGTAWVADFGLAKLDNHDLTRTGDVVGTIRYMAPERFERAGDARSDVYSLGMTLYEMLALRPAFADTGHLSLLERIRNQDPPRLRTMHARIPFDLETIVFKAIAKDPSRRYPDAQSLADDLDRFLEGQPIRARQVGWAERLWLWSRKHKSLAAALVCITLLIIAGTMGSIVAAAYYFQEQKQQAALAAENGELATRMAIERDSAYRQAYLADMQVAQDDLAAGNISRMVQTLGRYVPEVDQPDIRNWEWYYLLSRANQDSLTISDHLETVNCVRYSPDGTLIASAALDDTVQLHQTVDGKRLVRLELPGVRQLVFRPDGQQLATVGRDPVLRIWSVPDGQLVRAVRLNVATLNDVDWSRDGKQIVVCSDDRNQIIFIDAAHGEVAEALQDTARPAHARLSPDGKRLATGSRDVHVWDLATRQIEFTHDSEPGIEILGLAWHPRSQRIAICFYDNRIQIVSVDQQRVLRTIEDQSAVEGIVWDRRGTRLAVATRGQFVRIYDADSGALRNSFPGHIGWVKSIDFHPDGQSVVSGGLDGHIKFWDATPPDLLDPPRKDRLPPVESPDGKRIAATNTRNEILLIDKASGEVLWKQQMNNGGVLQRLNWDPTSSYVLTDVAELQCTWSADSGQRHSELNHAGNNTSTVSPDGRFVAFAPHPFYEGNKTGPIKIWDAIKNETVLEFEAHADGVFGLNYSPDGRLLASVGLGEVKVWEANTGRQIWAMYGHAPGQWLVEPIWSNDGKWLATSGCDQKVKVWDVSTGKQRWSLEAHVKSVFGIGFSPDGSRLVSASGNGTLILWDLETGREVLKLNAWQEYPGSRGLNLRYIEWSPDGRSFTIRENHQRRGWRWDARRGFEIASRGELGGPMQQTSEMLRDESAIQSFQAGSANSLAHKLLLDPTSPTFDPQRGLAEAEQALRLNPVADAAMAVGLARLRNEQWQSAIESLHNALSLEPDCVDVAGFMLAIAHAQLGQTDQATDWYLQAYDNLDTDAQNVLGRTMQLEADDLLQDALLARCQRELAALPADLEPMHRAASLSIRFQRRDQAIELLTGIIQRSPDDLTSLSQLARLYGERAMDLSQQDQRTAAEVASRQATQLLEQVIDRAEQNSLAKEKFIAERQLAEHLLANLVVWRPVDPLRWTVGDGWSVTVEDNGFGGIRPEDPRREYRFRFPASVDGVMGIRLEEIQQDHSRATISELQLNSYDPLGGQSPLEIDDVFAASNDTRRLLFAEFHPTAMLDGD